MDITRRDFVKSSLAIAGASRLPLGAAAPGIKKGLVFEMVSDKLSYGDRFKLVRDAGFEVVQALTEPDRGKAEEMKRAADAANLRIDSVMNVDHWQYPLSSSDPAVVEKSLSGMRMSLQNAKLWGADDWPAVRPAFSAVGDAGSVIAELDGGDAAYLQDVSRRIDRLLLG